MRLGPVLLLVWLVVLIGSCAAPLVHLHRHRTRGMLRTLAAPAGGLMSIMLWMSYVGVAEGAWTWSSPTLWLLLLLGMLGLAGIAMGWRAALRPKLDAGQCPRCGYSMQGLSCCPECGPRHASIDRSAP